MLKKRKWFVVLLMLLGMCLNAHAVTLVDNFDSYADGSLHGQGVAENGWAGKWDGLGDQEIYVYGGQIGRDHNGTGVTARKVRGFASPIAISAGAPTIWLSYDVKSDFNGSYNQSFGVTLGGVYPDGSYFPQNVFGRVGGSDYFSNWTHQSNPYYDISTTVIPDNQWRTVWVELVPTGSGTADYRMWVNPDVNLDPDDPNQVAPILDSTLQVDHDYFTYVGFASTTGTGGTNSDRFDNLRVSTDSAPTVPEPTTIGLLGLGGLLTVIRKAK